MYFNKTPYRANFEFIRPVTVASSAESLFKAMFEVVDFQPSASEPRGCMQISVDCRQYAGDIYRLDFHSRRWPRNYAQSDLQFPPTPGLPDNCCTRLMMNENFTLTLQDENGKPLLTGVPGQTFGVCGNASLFQFERQAEDCFYGMGEKMFGLELSGRSTKFWNTDVWGDFAPAVYQDGTPDPLYVSVPYLIIKRGDRYIGLLLDNPCATFISTNSKVTIAGQMEAGEQPAATLTLGAEHGQPNLIIIYGPTLAELTRKLQRLVGVTPLPPAWALGYHQCRWGYESYKDLNYISAAMDKFEIPCDGLWLDIEYMRGYRVFTFEEEHNFPELKANIADIQKHGRRVIPIIDPGVKAEPGYEIYDSGQRAGIFCQNPQGRDFVGLVWPGETVFPDFSTAAGRGWWAEQVARFAQTGITGAWLDMNDPSTGPALCTQMLFNHGLDSHYTYHNQYALGMAQASREGFAQAYPKDRPFLLSRSGFTGSSKYTAIWTGDNVSNYHYLQASIPCTLNLALSGIPFNGPDAGGFGGDTTPELMQDWYKAGFLFPFFRNHSIRGSANQEPWMFDQQTLDILRHFIRLRYKLRPYLYNLFIDQEESGEAILRPLFYDFTDTPELPLTRIADQFMVGPAIMQAPFVREKEDSRQVTLPAGRWHCPETQCWRAGGQIIRVRRSDATTPLFVRDGAILPLAMNADRGEHKFISNRIECHIFADRETPAIPEYHYRFDDGQSLAYRQGQRSGLIIGATISGGNLDIVTTPTADGFGPCEVKFILYADFDQVHINGRRTAKTVHKWQFTGGEQACTEVRESAG